MKKAVSQVMALTLVILLAKVAAPGTATSYCGVNGAVVSSVEQAMKFDSIKDAYAKQLEYGEGWQIVTE